MISQKMLYIIRWADMVTGGHPHSPFLRFPYNLRSQFSRHYFLFSVQLVVIQLDP